MTAITVKRLGLGGAALVLAAAGTATAATASTTGTSATARATTSPHHVTIAIGGNTQHPTVIVNGALHGSGKDDPNHSDFDVLHLNGGTLRVTHPNKDATYVPTVDRQTCYASFQEHGMFTLGHGTGKYAGITGSGKYHASGYTIAKRKKSGKCDFHAEPKVEIFTVHGSGTVH